MKKNTSKIKTEEDLKRVLEGVQRDLIHSNCYFRLFMDLDDSVAEYSKEMNQARTFWTLSRDALLESAILRLCRAFERDNDKNGNSLGFLLAAIKSNAEMFSFDSFKERMSSNEHSDPHESWRELDLAELDDDIDFASESNPPLKKLIYWRDKHLVHRDSTVVIRNLKLDDNNSLNFGEFTDLLKGGIAIVNRYSRLFHQTTHSEIMIGHDDYKTVLRLMRDGLRLRKQELDAEYRRFGTEPESD